MTYATHAAIANDGAVRQRETACAAQEGVTADAALGLLRRNKIEKLPIVDGHGRLTGLITV